MGKYGFFRLKTMDNPLFNRKYIEFDSFSVKIGFGLKKVDFSPEISTFSDFEMKKSIFSQFFA